MSVSEASAVAVLQRLFHEVWNSGHLSAADDLFLDAPPAVAFIAGFRSAFPDIHHTIDTTLVAGEQVVMRWRATATHQGAWHAIQPTYRTVAFTGITLATVRGGQIHHHVTEWDKAGLLAQLAQSDRG